MSLGNLGTSYHKLRLKTTQVYFCDHVRLEGVEEGSTQVAAVGDEVDVPIELAYYLFGYH